MLGQYMMVDDDILHRMMHADHEELIEEIETLSDEEAVEIYDIDKLWDGLHFLLTGCGASRPDPANPLSKAVVGVENMGDPDEDFITYTPYIELADILKALHQIDWDALEEAFDPAAFRANMIYPNIWEDGERESLFKELKGECKGLRRFYEHALDEKANVIFSIY